MDGMSREGALEVVGDEPDLCSVGKGECLKGAKGREHHCQRVEQPAQFHKLPPLDEQLCLSLPLPLRGDDCQSCNSGDPQSRR